MSSNATHVWVQQNKKARKWVVFETGADGDRVGEYSFDDKAAALAEFARRDRVILLAQYGGKLPAHTPGPWQVRGRVGCAGFGVNDSGNTSVAAFPSTMNRDPGERVANADLIAAAPDLLAMLELLVSVARQNAGRVDFETVRDAETTIAQARGQK